MLLEKTTFQLTPYQAFQNNDLYQIRTKDAVFTVSANQFRYLDSFAHGHSVQSLVQSFLKQGWLVSFHDIYTVLELCFLNKIIVHPVLQDFFQSGGISANTTVAPSAAPRSDNRALTPAIQKNQLQPTSSIDLKQLPFFRNLSDDIFQLFKQQMKKEFYPAQSKICKFGETSRDLYILNHGQVGIYKIVNANQKQLLSRLPLGAVFGEGGFLLGKPRGADVVALEDCEVLKISWDENIFGTLIRSDKAQSLQHRFWILHGLLSSPLFTSVPAETMDQFTFSGKLRPMKDQEVIVREGDPGRSFFVIVQGNIVFSKGGKSIRVLNQGEIFGEVALLVSGGVRTATAQAQRDGLLLEIEMSEFYQLLSQNLILARELEKTAWQRYQKAPVSASKPV